MRSIARIRATGIAALGAALAIGSSCAAHAAAAELPPPPEPLAQVEPLAYHVAPWGDDTWPGTRGRPFKTIARAQLAVRAHTAGMRHDLVVNLHGGTYTLAAPLELTDAAGDSGQNGHRVIWQAYRYGTSRQASVVLSGGRTVTGWRLDDPAHDVWRADVGDLDTRQLFVGGRRARRAAIDTDLPPLTRTPTGYTTTSEAPASWEHPEDVEFVFTGAVTWAEPICGVASIARADGLTTITMDQPCFRRAVALYGSGFFPGVGMTPATIENSKSFLAPGSFYLDRSQPGHHVLYYVPRAGEDLQEAHVVAPALEALVSGEGTDLAPLHDVTLRGLTFADGTWLQPGTEEGFVHYIAGLYENGDGSILAVTLSPQAQSMPGNVRFRRAERIVLERNRFERLGAQALELVGSDSVVRGNVFTDVSGGAILVGDDRPETAGAVSRGDRVEDNWIHAIGVQYRGGTAIFATRTRDLTIAHNQVDDVPYSGIVLGQGHEQLVRANGPQDPSAPRNTGARIAGNLVFDGMKVLTDGGGIYTTFKQGTSWDDGSVIEGNVVHDMHHPYLGVYTDWGSSWQTTRQNVIYDVWGSVGGCSVSALNAGISHIRYSGNFWVDPEPLWTCGPPEGDITLEDNTVLPKETAAAACAADPRCRAIVDAAGLEPAYRDLLD